MTSALLEALFQTVHGNSGVHNAVDGQIFKNKPLEESGAELKKTHKTIISCEISVLDGSRNSTDPTFIVDVRSKESYEYCAEVVQLLKDLLDGGFSYSGTTVTVLRIEAPILVSQELVGWRSQMKVHGTVNSPPTIRILKASIASPQTEGKDVTWVCGAAYPESDEILYRFWLKGPRTGSEWQDVTGWIPRNSWTWKTSKDDAGTSSVKVQVLDMKHASKGSNDAESDEMTYVITNSTPAITSLTTYPASPQVPNREIRVICVAADADSHELLYRFSLSGPGTDSKNIDLTAWQTKNWTVWVPKYIDSGANTLKCQIIDQKHADRGGYDAEATASFTVSP